MNFIKNLLADDLGAGTGLSSANDAIKGIAKQINTIASTIFGVLIIGMVGVAVYLAFKMFTASTEDKRKNAKGQMIYAIIGVVVLIIFLILTPVITNAINQAMTNTTK